MGKVILSTEQIERDARIHEQRGADRERRRIRRAQAKARNDLFRLAITMQQWGCRNWSGSLSIALKSLDAATLGKGRK